MKKEKNREIRIVRSYIFESINIQKKKYISNCSFNAAIVPSVKKIHLSERFVVEISIYTYIN